VCVCDWVGSVCSVVCVCVCVCDWVGSVCGVVCVCDWV